MQLARRQLPFPKAVFLQKLADYSAAREAHKQTVNVPAPFPEHDLLRAAYEASANGGTVTLVQETITAARYQNAEHATVVVTLQGDPGKYLVEMINPNDPYLWTLLQEWIASGNAIAAEPPPPTPPNAQQMTDAVNGVFVGVLDPNIDVLKLVRAKAISDLAFRLGKAPGALTAAEIAAERTRISNIYAAL